MNRIGVLFTFAFLLFVSLPGVVPADYLYPGSAAFQPLAVMEPATPDSLFHTWTGDLERGGLQNLGLSMDFLRNADDSGDWDVIFATTGSFRFWRETSPGDHRAFYHKGPRVQRVRTP